jgi:hypothetical protein
MSRRFPVVLAFATMSLLGAPAASHGAVVAGAVSDKAGDVGSPQQDIQTAAAVYDTDGSVRGAVALVEIPTYTGAGGVTVDLGAWSKKRGWCELGANVTMWPPDPELPEWYGGLILGERDGPDAFIFAQGTTLTFEVSGSQAAGHDWNCARALTALPDEAESDVTEVFSLTAQEAQRPDAPPECAVKRDRVRRGRKAAFRCSNFTGPLTIRVYRANKLKKTVKARVGPGGRVTASTRGLRRGWYAFYAWSGADVVGRGGVKVR